MSEPQIQEDLERLIDELGTALGKERARNQQLRERIEQLPQAVWKRIEGPGALSGELTSQFEPEPEERLVRLDDVLALLNSQQVERTNEESGLCCMTKHANAIPPWTCDCKCHLNSQQEK